jgi:hypothetical protein
MGTPVVSASSITATGRVFHVTGAAAIATLNGPAGYIAETLTLIPDGAFTTNASGNIAIASTAVVGKAMIMTYDPGTSKWYPSY